MVTCGGAVGLSRVVGPFDALRRRRFFGYPDSPRACRTFLGPGHDFGLTSAGCRRGPVAVVAGTRRGFATVRYPHDAVRSSGYSPFQVRLGIRSSRVAAGLPRTQTSPVSGFVSISPCSSSSATMRSRCLPWVRRGGTLAVGAVGVRAKSHPPVLGTRDQRNWTTFAAIVQAPRRRACHDATKPTGVAPSGRPTFHHTRRNGRRNDVRGWVDGSAAFVVGVGGG